MDLSIVFYLLILYFVVMPIFALVHELGHTFASLKLANQRTTIRLGTKGFLLYLRLGRLTLDLRIGYDSAFGIHRLNGPGPIPAKRRLWITVAGPLVTFLLLVISSGMALWLDGPNPWFVSFAWINAILLGNEMLPLRRASWMGVQAGVASDGQRLIEIWHELRGRTSHRGIGN